MHRNRYVLVSSLKVNGEEGYSRTMKKDEHLWAETPLGKDKVVVFLDTVPYWAYRTEFDDATRPIG